MNRIELEKSENMSTQANAATLAISKRRTTNRTRTNLFFDLLIFGAFLLSTTPVFTGIPIHEWLGLALAAGIVTHLLLHWQWLVEVTRRFFRKMPASTRINYILNALLFVAITLISFSGIMISRSIVPMLGIELGGSMIWKVVHTFSTDAIVFLMGLHVALHWSWIVNAFKRYVIQPLSRPFRRGLRVPELVPSSAKELSEVKA